MVTAGLTQGPVTASRGVTLLPDMDLDQAMKQDYDMLVLPGGLPGADHLNQDPRIRELLGKMAAQGRYTAAICAAPKVLASAGLLEGKQATGYPGVLNALDLPGVSLSENPVVKDGAVITSRGPGTAMDFALELIESLEGEERRSEVEAKLVRPAG